MKLNLQARLVAAVAQFKASNDIRFYLNGVYVEPRPQGGAVIVATNGHAIGVWLDESGEIERPAILRIGAKLQAACQGADTKRLTIVDDRLAVLSNDGTELHIQHQQIKMSGSWEIAGKFPDYKAVIKIPDSHPALRSALNPEYIARIDRALSIGIGNKSKSVTTHQNSQHEVIVFTSCAAPNFVGAIMPMRESLTPYPAWLKNMQARADMERRNKEAPLPVHEPSDAGPPDGDGRGWRIVEGGAK